MTSLLTAEPLVGTSPHDPSPPPVLGTPGLGTPVPGSAVVGLSLSPSRAADFQSCPLLYRFRCVDRLTEPPSAAASRGTLVHAVLDQLFALPAAERTPAAAAALLDPQWQRMRTEDPVVDGLFAADASGEELLAWLASAHTLLEGYFTLEDPRRLEPADRELYVEHVRPDGLRLRGYVDRLDVARDGAVRVVDYKTGRSPTERFEQRALFQLKFYALLVWRTRGVPPRMLQLLYLGDREVLRYEPDAQQLASFERVLVALAEAIARAHANGDWRPRPSRLCDWCAHQALCPAFGGTPPPLPDRIAPAGASA